MSRMIIAIGLAASFVLAGPVLAANGGAGGSGAAGSGSGHSGGGSHGGGSFGGIQGAPFAAGGFRGDGSAGGAAPPSLYRSQSQSHGFRQSYGGYRQRGFVGRGYDSDDCLGEPLRPYPRRYSDRC